MKLFILFFCLYYPLFCQSQDCQEAFEYFAEVALGGDFGGKNMSIKKWGSPIYWEVKGDSLSPGLISYLDSALSEIDNLTGTKLKIRRANSYQTANFIIYFGHGQEYAKLIEPQATWLIENSWGLAWCHWNDKGSIYKGSIYVDIYRANRIAEQRHLLKEELTQALGLFNDSWKYPNSIFYEDWTTTDTYTEIDKQIISWLYSPHIEAGMSYVDLVNIQLNCFLE